MITSRLYYSREDRVAEITDEKDRVQWQNVQDDVKKIDEAAETFDEYVEELFNNITAYNETLTEELDDPDFQEAAVAHARRELIESWALTQAALSKIAHVVRFNGNDAFQRMMDALKTGDAADMRGL